MSLNLISQGFSQMLGSAWYIFTNWYGWLLFVWMFIYIVFVTYLKNLQDAFVLSHEQVFFQVKVERENLQSTVAIENLFAQLHAIHTSFTWAEKYLEGKINLWISMEIVSLGGRINYVIKTPKKYSTLVRSAFFANYPNAEITEIKDYMENLRHWDHHHGNWDLWGTEFKLTRDYAYPIKTYREFEHNIVEEKFIDPLAGILEALSHIEPHELMAVQYVIRPLADAEWTPHVIDVVKELKKETVHKSNIFDRIFGLFDILGKKTLTEAVFERTEKDEHGDNITAPQVMRMSEAEKQVLELVQKKAAKPGWDVKMRIIYVAPKDRFDGTKKTAFIGGFRQLSGMLTNNLKPDTQETWTSTNYHVLKNIEAPYTEFRTIEKKESMLKGFSNRSRWVGAYNFILNGEELATLFHFPLSTNATPPVERIDIKKGQPPANLPVG